MKYRVAITGLLVFFLTSCSGSDGESSTKLKGTQSAEIDGRWKTKCSYNLYESSDETRVYSIEQHQFTAGSLLINYDHYSDSSCVTIVKQEEYIGTYELGDVIEINFELFARNILERFDPKIEGVSSVGWDAYFFISENILYFGGDRGENGELPNLQTDKPYYFVE